MYFDFCISDACKGCCFLSKLLLLHCAGAVPSLVLAKEMNMVFVSFNYRLNVFGYLAIKSGQETLNGNYGLADQILALQWVQKNIRLFGGAANKVRIFY